MAQEVSHPNKSYFPKEDLTKGEIFEYYERVGERMLSYLAGRPLSMRRFPEGIGESGFYQKSVPDHFPDWIKTIEVEKKEDGESQELVDCCDLKTLLYLANQGVLEFHPWLSRKDKLNHPDRAIVDLDPDGDDPELVRRAALTVMKELQKREEEVYVCTTGSSGYHLVMPRDRKRTFEEVREELQELAAELAEEHSDLLTDEHRKEKRKGRVYLDVARNAYAQTSICIYSVRAIPGAPVAVPLRTDELEQSDLTPQKYTVQNLFRRLGQVEDPWDGFPSSG